MLVLILLTQRVKIMTDKREIEIYLQEIKDKLKDSIDDIFNALEIIYSHIEKSKTLKSDSEKR